MQSRARICRSGVYIFLFDFGVQYWHRTRGLGVAVPHTKEYIGALRGERWKCREDKGINWLFAGMYGDLRTPGYRYRNGTEANINGTLMFKGHPYLDDWTVKPSETALEFYKYDSAEGRDKRQITRQNQA